jgi:hypothetical protein
MRPVGEIRNKNAKKLKQPRGKIQSQRYCRVIGKENKRKTKGEVLFEFA